MTITGWMRHAANRWGSLLAVALFLSAGTAPPVGAQARSLHGPADSSRFSVADVESEAADSLNTEVLVLGTPHLVRLRDRFRPALLDGLIDLLAAYDPDAVAVERLPPDGVAAMQAMPGYEAVLQRFAPRIQTQGRRAQAELGIDFKTAARRADSLLARAETGAPLPPPERLTLIHHLLAAYHIDTAALQWRYLPAAVRGGPVALSDEAVQYLENRRTSRHEIDALAARLGERLGLQRLVPIDDHREKAQLFALEADLEAALPPDSLIDLETFVGGVWSRRNQAAAQGDLLPFYRYVNSTAFLEEEVRTQWLLFHRMALPSALGRQRLALWEARNLAIATHLRTLTARHAGGRILVIIGGSHKPFLDAYLDTLIGVRRINLDALPDPSP